MKKVGKILLGILAVAVVGIIGLLAYVKLAMPGIPVDTTLKVEVTPARLERGRYLAHHVAVCMDCHSGRDMSKFGFPMAPGTLGKGGMALDEQFGFPGSFTPPNITPAALASWTDGELYRAIAEGVSRDGRPLFPVMNHPAYGKMDKEDLYSLIAYVRSLPAIEGTTETPRANFPMNFILHTIPQPASHSPRPDTADRVAYGKYLFVMASCSECHTQIDKGKPIPGLELAGGRELPLPSGIVRSANITPDNETGLGRWTEAQFVSRFKAYADTAWKPATIQKGDFNTVMPWLYYSHMTEGDLKAIYAYLRTVPAVKNEVEKFTPAE